MTATLFDKIVLATYKSGVGRCLLVKTMYQYEDPPEVQSPEQRSVVFASLACLVTSLFSIWPNEFPPEYCAKTGSPFWIRMTIPILVSFVILYRGGLWTTWPKLRRAASLALIAGLIVVGELVFFFCTGITAILALAKICQVRDWN
ncbi:MAG: hypothetical protein P4N60_15005 [Verrucomicrobiae bacterium]|nr:hypothetical protein [Verrucomicrobiae bacterium]